MNGGADEKCEQLITALPHFEPRGPFFRYIFISFHFFYILYVFYAYIFSHKGHKSVYFYVSLCMSMRSVYGIYMFPNKNTQKPRMHKT